MSEIKVKIVSIQLRPTINLTVELIEDESLAEIMERFNSANGVEATLKLDK